MKTDSDIVLTFDNGLRFACRKSDSPVSYIGVLIGVGSRDDFPQYPGLAHFIEHTIFKGTESRKAFQISGRMEAIGGELNAYTTKEETMIYTNAPAGFEERAFDLLSDLICNPTFPEKELELERGVITEEIFSYHDNPSDAVYDEFDELLYAGSALAHNILGTVRSVDEISSDVARKFVDRYYVPQNMVVYCVSPSDQEHNIRLAEKYFGAISRSGQLPAREAAPIQASFSDLHPRDNHQANSISGLRVFGRRDPRRHALFLLNNYLGGPAMNSRLNRELRERRGLVYTVDSSLSLYSDTGALQIFYGSHARNVNRCRKLIEKEIQEVAASPLSEKKFNEIKQQYCGHLLVSGDHRESSAMAMAKSLMYYGKIHDISYTTDKIMNLTREDLRATAELVASTPLSNLTLL